MNLPGGWELVAALLVQALVVVGLVVLVVQALRRR